MPALKESLGPVGAIRLLGTPAASAVARPLLHVVGLIGAGLNGAGLNGAGLIGHRAR